MVSQVTPQNSLAKQNLKVVVFCVYRIEICTGMEMARIPKNLREWVQLLQEYCWDGTKTCGNTAGMEYIAVGNPRSVFGKRATKQFFSLKFLTC